MHPTQSGKRSAASLAGIALSVCAALSGCTVGPNYVKPAAAVPANYKEAAADGTAWKIAQPGDRAGRGKWWMIYDDPLLNALQDVVTSSNQDLKIAQSRYAQARALVEGARGNYLPTVTAGASVSRFRKSGNAFGNTPASVGPANDFQLPLDVSWELDIWGRVRRAVESSEASAQAFAADLETIRLSLQAELAANYFLLRGIDSERLLLDRTLVSYRKAHELTISRHEGGVASDADVAQAETQLRTAEAQAMDLRVRRAQLEHAIAVLIGKTPAEFSLAQVGLESLPPQVPLVMPSELLERRPDIASAERQMASANAQIGVAKAAYFPALTLPGSIGFSSTAFSHLFEVPNRFWSIGPALGVTLLDFGVRGAAVDAAVAAWDESAANYRQAVLTGFQDVEDNLATLRILAEEAQVQDDAVRASRETLLLTTNQYKAGTANYLAVVVVQTQQLANERSAVILLGRRLTASVGLILALGGGYQGDIRR